MIGVDLVEINWFKDLVKDQVFVKRVFDTTEIPDSIENLAVKFSLKEAYFKATQCKIRRWNEIIVDIANHEIKSRDICCKNFSYSKAKDHVISIVHNLSKKPSEPK